MTVSKRVSHSMDSREWKPEVDSREKDHPTYSNNSSFHNFCPASAV